MTEEKVKPEYVTKHRECIRCGSPVYIGFYCRICHDDNVAIEGANV